jgi:carboxypeptidase family protein
VAGNSVEGLRLNPQPGGSIRGRLRVESQGPLTRFDPRQMFLSLQSTDGEDDAGAFTLGEGFSNLAHVAPDGGFAWNGVPPGDYSVHFITDSDANADWYLKSTLIAGRDVNDSGISVNGGALALDLIASPNGAVAEGVAIDRKGDPVPNAVIVAVPEPRLRGRVDRYRKTVSDQGGRFTLHGLPPGSYTVFAWESVDGEAYYNPDFLKTYEPQGTQLHLTEGDRKPLQLEVIPEAENQ